MKEARVIRIPPGISGEDLHGRKNYWSIKGTLGADAHRRRLKAALAGVYAKNSDARMRKEEQE